MTPAPIVEVLLVVLAAVMGAWMLSYLVHSTLAIIAAALVIRARNFAPFDQVRIWRYAIVAPFVTATLQVAGVLNTPSLSWEVSTILPQTLVDWRLGVVGLAMLIVGTVTLAVAWITGALVLRRLLGRRRPAPASLQEEVACLAVVVGCRVPRVTVSDAAAIPSAIGFSEVCMPAASLEAMPADERRTLLAHEVGHLVARDPLWFAMAGNLSRLALFQPLNRWAVRRLRAASEEAADDFSSHATGDPVALARALAGLASLLWILPGGAGASGSPVVTRVGRLLDDAPRPRAARPAVRRAATAASLAAMLLIAPGFSVSIDDVANRLPWLAPSRDQPNARMLEVRQFSRDLRDRIRRALR